MDGQRFDRLAKTIAADVSRRGVAKGIGGGLLAAALAGIGRGAVAASNSACAHFCNAIFPPGPARGTCKSDAAKHVPGNLCEACGADPGQVFTGPDGEKTCCDPALLCPAPNGDTTCCAAGEICMADGACIPPPPPCDLIITAPCDLKDDQCCGTINKDPLGSVCKNVEDIYPELISRCCIPNDTGIPCSGSGGNHCPPDSSCSMCCSGQCGPADETGFAVCVGSASS